VSFGWTSRPRTYLVVRSGDEMQLVPAWEAAFRDLVRQMIEAARDRTEAAESDMVPVPLLEGKPKP
jgi:hypothetical protein